MKKVDNRRMNSLEIPKREKITQKNVKKITMDLFSVTKIIFVW